MDLAAALAARSVDLRPRLRRERQQPPPRPVCRTDLPADASVAVLLNPSCKIPSSRLVELQKMAAVSWVNYEGGPSLSSKLPVNEKHFMDPERLKHSLILR